MILEWAASGDKYIGLNPLLRFWPDGGAPSAAIPATARGDIDYDQIRVSARTGNGNQLLTWTTPAPAVSASTGTTGQIAYDSAGNFYWCYAANSWARIGTGGYSNSF